MCSIYIHASYLIQTYFDFPIEKSKFDKIQVLVFGKNVKTQKWFHMLDI